MVRMNLWIYGGLALGREFLAVIYYQSISNRSALLASVANLLIEVFDYAIGAAIIGSILFNKDFSPAAFYAVFGSLGVYVGVKLGYRKAK